MIYVTQKEIESMSHYNWYIGFIKKLRVGIIENIP